MVIRQGDIYWVELAPPMGSEPGHRHLHVVVQNNLFNRSRIGTVVVCALTSSTLRAAAPGNVLLSAHEANLPKQSVVNVSQPFTVDKTQLDEYIGSLGSERVSEIMAGIRLVLEPRDVD